MGVFLHKAALYKVKDQLKLNLNFQLNTYPYSGISNPIHPIQSHIHLWKSLLDLPSGPDLKCRWKVDVAGSTVAVSCVKVNFLFQTKSFKCHWKVTFPKNNLVFLFLIPIKQWDSEKVFFLSQNLIFFQISLNLEFPHHIPTQVEHPHEMMPKSVINFLHWVINRAQPLWWDIHLHHLLILTLCISRTKYLSSLFPHPPPHTFDTYLFPQVMMKTRVLTLMSK